MISQKCESKKEMRKHLGVCAKELVANGWNWGWDE